VKPHPTDMMLAQLLFSLDNNQLVLFAHLVGCETCRKTLAEMPPERLERYGMPGVKTTTTQRIPAELLSFPLDEEGRPRPPRPRPGRRDS
jgi:hypothetical protein